MQTQTTRTSPNCTAPFLIPAWDDAAGPLAALARSTSLLCQLCPMLPTGSWSTVAPWASLSVLAPGSQTPGNAAFAKQLQKGLIKHARKREIKICPSTHVDLATASGHMERPGDIPYHHSLLCLTSSYMTCEFFMVNSSSLPLEIVSLNLQPCYRAAGTSFPSSTYKDPIFLDLHAEQLFPRKTPTLGCALARHALQSYPKGNIAPSTTIKTNQAPTAQWTHSQDETKQGLSSPEPGLTLHLPNIRAAPDGCTGTVALHNTIFPLLLLALERTQYQHLLSLLPPAHEESRDP